ncbi:COQ9 family protein [Salibaculum halophilum]|uniref:COQ9 family protein n=1 Tax=Salibaculum halophilum TaxID=1914408 RepID=UPI000A10CEE2|nr:COQ9 family protein [Salibaculum halophilum]
MYHPAPDPRTRELLAAIVPHVVFDGWSEQAFRAACSDIEMPLDEARLLCPRGAVDLAVLFHREGDQRMVDMLDTADLSQMRFREKVAHAIRLRLQAAGDKEAVRRGTSLFALPHMAAEGSGLIWGTADAIWTALGDTSEDANWYTKRATLSAVYGSVVLFWLGDTSPDDMDTDAFIDRRIADVMRFEKVKAAVNDNPLLKPLTVPLGKLAGRVRAPRRAADDLPGRWAAPR